MKYKVGQIFYLVGSETAKVIPFRIVEEITRTTLEGIEKSFMAELPDGERTRIDVSKLKGEVFSNVNDLRLHMISNATSAIEGMLDSAQKIAEHVYGTEKETPVKDTLEDQPKDSEADQVIPESDESNLAVQPNEKSDILKVDMGDGLIANVNVSELNKVRI